MARAVLGIRSLNYAVHERVRPISLPGTDAQSSKALWSKRIPAGLSKRSSQGHSSKVYAMAADAFPTQFPEPVKAYDAHIYFHQGNPASSESARALREAIIEKFPHLEVYKFWEKPIGPHPTGMFEVDMRTPAQFAEFVPWIQVHHGVHSVLIHPQTGDDYGDHTHRALWLGEKMPLITDILKGERPAS